MMPSTMACEKRAKGKQKEPLVKELYFMFSYMDLMKFLSFKSKFLGLKIVWIVWSGLVGTPHGTFEIFWLNLVVSSRIW
jgi:hypothetical protein